jgi:ABC-2 type transport system permease protein
MSENGSLVMVSSEKKYGLSKERMASNRLYSKKNNYISSDADWLSFETTVSTWNQTAIAPGYLQKQWKDGRNYFITKWIKNVEFLRL